MGEVGARRKKKSKLTAPPPRLRKEHYRSLFEDSPISLWEEDFSRVKQRLDALRESGVSDFATYFAEHPEAVRRCAALVKIVDVNQATLKLFEAPSKSSILAGLDRVFLPETYTAFGEELIALAQGATDLEIESVVQTLTGKTRNTMVKWSIAPGIETSLNKILVSVIDITGWRRAEEELKESQRVLSTLMSNLPGMVYRCRNDAHWTMEFVSAGCRELTGYLPADLVENRNLSFAELIHPGDRKRIQDEVEAALQQKKPFQFSYRIGAASGQKKWVWEQGRGVFTPEGDLLALEGYITDISEREHAEGELIQLRAAIEQAAESIIITDHEGTIEYVNPAFTATTGYTREESLGHNPRFLKSGMHDDNFYAELWRTITAGEIWQGEITNRRKDGTLFTERMIITPVRDAGAIVTDFIAIKEDVTERKRAEEALQREQALLKVVLDSIDAGIMACDSAGILTLFNRATQEMHGLPQEEIPTEQWADHYDLFHPDGRTRMCKEEVPLYRALQGEYVRGREMMIVPKNGRTRTVLASAQPMFDPKGRKLGAVAAMHDITDYKRAREALQKSERRLSLVLEATSEGVWDWNVQTGEVYYSPR